MSLADLLLSHAGGARAALSEAPDLEARLEAAVAAGREAWPGLVLAPEVFVRHLAEALAQAEDPGAALDAVAAADLYLACACALGDPPALAALEQTFIARLPLPSLPPDAGLAGAEDLRQALRERLLVAEADRPPRIAGYTGRGPLGAWLRVALARLAVDLRRLAEPADPLEAHPPLRTAAPDPELAHLKQRYRREFEEAFEETLAALPSREASLLRFFFLDGLGAKAIGALYRASERTVQRWLADIRQHILDETHRKLAARLSVPPSEVESIYDLVASQIDLRLTGHFRKR